MKKVLILISCFLLIFPLLAKASGTEAVMQTVNSTDLAPNAKSAVLLEATTGKVLFEKNSHEKLPPASMTKIMSMLLVIEAIEKGNLSWDEMITVSENASSMGGSQILLETGEQMTVSDLFKGVAVASGNDAVVALAEAVAGTTDEFVLMMNNKVKELGLKDTNFKNPHGLDEANHYSTAYDMAMISKELVKHKKVLEYTGIYEDYLRKGTEREFWLTNTNKLTRFKAGVDGLKTGYTEGAGYCLTGTMSKNNMRLIATVMGEETSVIRNTEVSTLLDYGFAQYQSNQVLSTNNIVSKVKVNKGKEEYSDVVPTEEVNLILKKNEELGKITYDINIENVASPVKVGDVIGKLKVLRDKNVISEVNLTVKKNNDSANFLELYLRHFNHMINGKISF